MLIVTPFSHIPCSNEIRQQTESSFFFLQIGFSRRGARERKKKGCFAVYSKIAPGVDLVGTIKKRICYTCEGIDHMVKAEKL